MRLASILALAAILFVNTCRRPETTTPMMRSVTLVAPRTAWAWPMYIAKKAGYYEKYGLNVDLKFANHPAGIAMLSSGEAEVNLLPLQRAMEVSSIDDSFVFLGSPLGKWLFALIARPDISVATDLKGKKIGFAQPGDATYSYAVQLLAKFGLSPKDVQLVTIGAEGRIPALAAGLVDATMLSAPVYFALEAKGFRSLGNISDFDDIRATSVLIMKKATVGAIPDLPEVLIKAHAEAVKRFYEDKEFAIAAHLAFDKQDPMGLDRVYQAYAAKHALARIPYITAAEVRYVIENAAVPAASRMESFDFHTVIDNRTIDDLMSMHFFEQVFGKQVHEDTDVKTHVVFR